jgi:urease accessory protein
MATTTDTAITDAALLQLIWLASPALPVGGFSYSEGLEAAAEAGLVRDEESAAAWIAAQLHASLARADLSIVCAAAQAAREGNTERLARLDAWVRTTRETSEFRQQAEQMGRSMMDWMASIGRGDARNPDAPHARRGSPAGSPPTYPVAFAVAAAATEAPIRQVALAYAFGWAENMMQSAIKAVPLGQSAGQRILARLAREIPGAVDHALSLPDAGRQAFTPMLAILSAQHETQYSRLFRS